MEQEDVVSMLEDVVNWIIQDGAYRERLEFIKGYESGLRWFETFSGGARLNAKYNELLEVAKTENGIKVNEQSGVIETPNENYGFMNRIREKDQE